MQHPFVILWYVTNSDTNQVCFQQMRVHYPNVPVVIFRVANEILTDLMSYMDEYVLTIHRDVCANSLDVWKAYYQNESYGQSAVLWPSHLYVGSKPLPPLVQPMLFFVHDSGNCPPSNRREYEESVEITKLPNVAAWPKTEDLFGYLRRSVFDDVLVTLHEPRSLVLYLAFQNKLSFMFTFSQEYRGSSAPEYMQALQMCRAPVYQLLSSNST